MKKRETVKEKLLKIWVHCGEEENGLKGREDIAMTERNSE